MVLSSYEGFFYYMWDVPYTFFQTFLEKNKQIGMVKN